MKKMNTLTVNGVSYTIEDARAVSYAESQALTEEQKAQARENIGAEAQAQYELIEDITLEEDVASVIRKTDPNGQAYNFSAVRIYITTAVASKNAQIIFRTMNENDTNMIYHQIADAFSNAESKRVGFVARNDHGFIDYYVAMSSDTSSSSSDYRIKPGYIGKRWGDITELRLTTYYSQSTTVPIPAGTRIRIYAVRG